LKKFEHEIAGQQPLFDLILTDTIILIDELQQIQLNISPLERI
jgi:hypothetical protein